jgi:branched-chain amino acid transport system permease protein
MSLDYFMLPLTLFAIQSIAALSLQLVLGGAGLLSLGHAAYFAIGGYVSASVTVFGGQACGMEPGVGLLLLGLLCGSFASAICAFLVALPTLRLSGDYLAVATLGFGEIVSTSLKNLDVVGGTRGFKDIPKLSHPLAIFAVLGAVFLFIYRFYKTGTGLSVLATRDDDIAARSLGISPFRTKVTAFVIGASLSALAGGLYAHTVQFLSPEAAGFERSVEIVLAVVMGGMYSLRGCILGALILVGVPEVLRFAPAWISSQRMLFFAVIVIGIMLLNPKGLSGWMDRFWVKEAKA